MTRKGRRRRGEGAVYQRASDGLWVGMLDLGIIAGQRRRKTVYGQTEREAIEKLSTLQVTWLGDDDRLHLSAAADRAARMAEELESIRAYLALPVFPGAGLAWSRR